MSGFLKYLRIYRCFLANCFTEAMSYRSHFVLLIFLDLVFYGSSLLSVHVIYLHVDQIGPWSRENFLLFVSFMIAVDHLHMTFVSMSFWILSDDIKTGKLDFVLLRPASELFSIFLRHIRVGTLCNAPWPWILICWYGRASGLAWTSWIALPFLVVFAVALLTSIEIVIAASMFWIIESRGINFLRLHLQTVARWPDFVYRYYFKKFFIFVVPVLLVASAPVHFLIDPLRWQLLAIAVGVSLLLLVLIRISYRAGFRRYESASS